MYTIEDLEKEIATVHEPRRSAIRRDRGRRYGSPEDTLSNVAKFGWAGAVINLYECAQRLANMVNAMMYEGRSPEDADVINAADDAANYATYVAVLLLRAATKPAWTCVIPAGKVKPYGDMNEAVNFSKL